MAEPNVGEEAGRPKASLQELEEVVRTMGHIFANTFLYGAGHGVTLKASDDCFNTICLVLQKCGELSFSVSEGSLTVNEIIVEQKNPLMRAFAARMTDLDISSFAVTEGLARERFDKLIEIMNSKPEQLKASGGFAQAVVSAQLENVRTRVVTYKAVTEDEIIVSKKSIDDAMQGSGASVAEMVAFLGGGTGAESQATGANGDQEASRARGEQAVQQMAAEPGKLGDVIIQAAESGRAKQGPHSQQEVTAMVVACLRKVYDVLAKNPIVKTQKGKKNLGRTLATLETEILARMKARAADGGGVSGEQAKSISEAVEAMNDEVEIETLAEEYMRKRDAIEANERRILRFIRSKGLDKVSDTELRRRLEEGGLSPEQWQELLSKSGVGRREGVEGLEGAAAEGHLAILLANMEDLVASRARAVGRPLRRRSADLHHGDRRRRGDRKTWSSRRSRRSTTWSRSSRRRRRNPRPCPGGLRTARRGGRPLPCLGRS